MSGYPLVLDGAAISAVVVGGGAVATRKAIALVDAGAVVRVLAPTIATELEERASTCDRLTLTRARYAPDQIAGATLVVAATNDDAVNARIAADARACGLLVNVVSEPQLGTCITPAVHRAGDIVVAVSAGGVPRAAARLRDAIARWLDARFAASVSDLTLLRRDLLARGQRDRWRTAAATLLDEHFVEQVQRDAFAERIAEWR